MPRGISGDKNNREQKALRHVAMVTQFLDYNKPKTSLRKRIRTVSNFFDFMHFHLICPMLAKFLGESDLLACVAGVRKGRDSELGRDNLSVKNGENNGLLAGVPFLCPSRAQLPPPPSPG